MNDPYENIYPLTIVKMRYGGLYVAFNCDNDSNFIDAVQGNEEVYYNVGKYIDEHYYGAYGIGNTLDEAMENLKGWRASSNVMTAMTNYYEPPIQTTIQPRNL